MKSYAESNPFALIKASDYTDRQINSFWVELGDKLINQIIEPKSRVSKFILGGKGTGKTHLLRHFSYPVARLRHPDLDGVGVVRHQGSLAIFLRATGTDAARFEGMPGPKLAWQQLFGVYLELRLAEGVIEALQDIQKSSPGRSFDGAGLCRALARSIEIPNDVESIEQLAAWLVHQRRRIDSAVNNAAFSGRVSVEIPFSLGTLCLPLGAALASWCADLSDLPLIYLVDEIENFSTDQQQVVNSLIRYSGGSATFRISGRLYAMQTHSTMGGGEENRDGSEFRLINLDSVLRESSRYPKFAREFVAKRLAAHEDETSGHVAESGIHPEEFFEELDQSNFYSALIRSVYNGNELAPFADRFVAALADAMPETDGRLITNDLMRGLPPMLAALNMLLFCKKWKRGTSAEPVVSGLVHAAARFALDRKEAPDFYRTAYNHYSQDLLAQFLDLSGSRGNVPYAGFKTFVQMSCSNPRSLLVVLGRIYAATSFHQLPFSAERPVPVRIQAEAAVQAAQFMYESDTNYGTKAENARHAAARLAELLSTARFALNVPEVSPLSVTLAEDQLTEEAKRTLRAALNYSFLFADAAGRPDRNSKRIRTKLSLNPLLSPKWALPVKKGGDISLDAVTANAVFDPAGAATFDVALRSLSQKWNRPFRRKTGGLAQPRQELLI